MTNRYPYLKSGTTPNHDPADFRRLYEDALRAGKDIGDIPRTPLTVLKGTEWQVRVNFRDDGSPRLVECSCVPGRENDTTRHNDYPASPPPEPAGEPVSLEPDEILLAGEIAPGIQAETFERVQPVINKSMSDSIDRMVAEGLLTGTVAKR